MQYISTRGEAPKLGFDDVLLAGLANDGGLYVPESWPKVDAETMRSLRGLSYPELAVEVLRTHFHPGQFQVQELLRGRTGSYGDI